MSSPRSPEPIFDTLDEFRGQSYPKQTRESFVPHDFEMAKNFLIQYTGSRSTFEAYRRELERFLQWSWHVKKQSLLVCTRADLESYLAFCQSPPKAWIGRKRVARFITRDGIRTPNPDWRLFVLTHESSDTFNLSQQALAGIFVALGSFYNNLLADNLIKHNPVAQIRQKSKFFRKHQGHRKIRRLTDIQWHTVMQTAYALAEADPKKHERTLFIMTALYLLYLRISELVTDERFAPQMGHFFQDGYGNWWFKTVSKGNKERDITVPDAMLDALKRYRTSRGLFPALPLANDTTPLITSLRNQQPIRSDRQIREIVQTCFDCAEIRLQQQGLTDEAQQLKQATVHWLRHTGISDDINKRGRPIAHVRDDAGHSSSAITDKYNDITLQERHASAKQKQIDSE